MKICIVEHEPLPAGHPEVHRFTYEMSVGGTAISVETVSVRTARILAQRLDCGTAFVSMLNAIANCADDQFVTLVHRTFHDA